MASADVVMMNGGVGSQRHHCDDISYALLIKREEIDKEIRDFRAQKEEEYKLYEEQLRRQKDDGITKGREDQKEDAPNAEQSGDQRTRPRMHRRTSSEQRRQNRPPRTARQALNQAFSTSSEEGRDFEGVFTPEYLGLIDIKPKMGGSHSSLDRPDLKSHLSSSDTLHPPLVYPWSSSPIPSYNVSTSAPEHNSPVKSHHRSDSTNSTLSVQSLRSSMKDPKTPKSPKRVLFSIEDGVVSPSTSPSLNRKDKESSAGGENAPESLLSFAKRTSREKKKKNRRKERGDGDRGRKGRDDLDEIGISENRGFSTLQQEPWNSSVPILPARDGQANGPVAAGQSSVLADSELADSLSGDDMFTFDEELSSESAQKPSHTKDEVDLEEEVDAIDSKALDELGTSPHAGSLPIEIKFPERRVSGGSG